MVGVVVAFAGGIGAGKSQLTRALSAELNWPRVSFGDHVRNVAKEAGEDPEDRFVLQRLGQSLVLTNPREFVERVIAQGGANSDDKNLIVDGVRHVEILLELRAYVRPRPLHFFYIKADATTRQERVIARPPHVERRVAARYDSDITEAQIARILPQYADRSLGTLDGSLPTSLLVEEVKSRLFSVAREQAQRA